SARTVSTPSQPPPAFAGGGAKATARGGPLPRIRETSFGPPVRAIAALTLSQGRAINGLACIPGVHGKSGLRRFTSTAPFPTNGNQRPNDRAILRRMSTLTATAKGAATREAIVDRAYAIACANGLEGLSIAPLADAVRMSQSGVFAHFGSREGLPLAVLADAAERFGIAVLIPPLSRPRGQPRLRAIMQYWFEWRRLTAGGCVLLGAASEYDDRRGPLRDRVVHNDLRWRAELRRAIGQAVEVGHLAPGDADQRVFELYAIALAVHHDAGLYDYETAR